MKFSIITPVYNCADYISETIESVISQKGNFGIEYIIIDNCSSDSTVEVLKKYEKLISENIYPIKCNHVSFRWISERDNGMYDAINKGFSLASGDIYAWINADDIYLPGAFSLVAQVLETYREIQWLKGITCHINEHSTIYGFRPCLLYDQNLIRKGVYGRSAYFIHQESVFWTANLWKKVGGANAKLKMAGDYDLWIRFAALEPLYSVKAYLSCFRRVNGQLSQNIEYYKNECRLVSPCNNWLFEKKVQCYIKCIKYCYRLPKWVQKMASLMLGGLNYYFIEFDNNDMPVLKKVDFCRQ